MEELKVYIESLMEFLNRRHVVGGSVPKMVQDDIVQATFIEKDATYRKD